MKVFKQAAGMTLVAYLNHVRLSKAARMLIETDRSIAEIASASGFSDQSYFDKRFKRALGRTPKEFRTGARLNSDLHRRLPNGKIVQILFHFRPIRFSAFRLISVK